VDPPVLVTGATGYIGGRLVPRLLEAGHRVRCLAREPRKLDGRPWASHARVELVAGDTSDPASLRRALEGCGVAYYLVHSMVAAGHEYAERDRAMARTFARAAEDSGLERIVYLGGLGELGAGLSEHLASRREVEEILASGQTPVTVLRAAMIIGSGSASFEILRYLVERLPVMVTPRWVSTESQPIAVRNVVQYLVDCLGVPATSGRTLDVGGPDVLSYRELMRIMAEERGLRRRYVIPVPVLTPRLSSLWIHLVTPISHRIARPLAEGLRNRVVCRNDEARRLMPQELLGVRQAIRAALDRVAHDDVETSWSMAGPIPGDPDWAGGTVFTDRRTIVVEAAPLAVWRAVVRIGGGHGWYAAQWLWRVRGFLDRLVGGPGLRRGRRDADEVGYGEALDFWRVTGIDRGKRLSLRAEMKLPGEALLEFTVSSEAGGTRLTQTARFQPRGLAGLAYWYAVLPLHAVVFDGMLQGIRTAALLTPSVGMGLIAGSPHPCDGHRARGRPEDESRMSERRAAITALGTHVPEKVVTNADLEKIVDTTDEWIRTRTGIHQRHVVEPGTPTSVIASLAAQDALRRRGIGAEEIDLIVVATVTPDMLFPATACLVQERIGARKAWGFDVSAACSGFVYALTIGAQFVETGRHRKVMVIGADVMTSILDYEDRTTCILFGDAAGAVILEAREDGTGILDFSHEVDGTGAPYLSMPAGGSLHPATHETVDRKMHTLKQQGQHVFKYAVRKFADASEQILLRNDFTGTDVDLFVAHQANIRIIEAAQHRMGLPDSKVIKNIHEYGNTTAATIPLAMKTALDQKKLAKGHLVLLAAVGAGFTVGSVLLRWSGVSWD
jgi:3-oxoacyl-(acyl-carrier-protein) synthase III